MHTMAVNSRPPAEGQGPPGGQVSWPVRSGAVPPLADGFVARPETAPGLGAALVPGATVALVPDHVSTDSAPDWLGSCGKTQLAVSCAESLWQIRRVELLIWVDASSRASVLTGYGEAAAAAMGTDTAGDAEPVAARFLSWLSESSRSWLVVLDDLSDPAELDGLWPEGPSGRILITTASPAIASGEHQVVVHPVGAFSPREALSYLMGRLTADTDQRLGAIDLVEDLGREPLALTEASAVIAGSALSCRDYRDYFLRRREQIGRSAASSPSAATVTWTFSFEQLNRQSPGGDAQALLGLAALLDGHAIPGPVFTARAAREYLAPGSAGESASARRAQAALVVGEQAGLLAIDRAATPPVVRMNRVVQAAVRAAMPDEVLDRAVRAAADALLEVWPKQEPRTWLTGSLRSATASLQQAAGTRLWADGCHPLLLRAGRSLNSARLTGPAVAYWSELAGVSDRVLGSGHPDTLLTGEQLAAAYLTAGRAADAVPWLRWALARRERELGPDHPGTVQARRNLGHALVAASQFSDAITVLTVAADDCERIRGPEHLETLGARDELAAAYRAAGQFRDAIRWYQRALRRKPQGTPGRNGR
jgi:tetratricopeptide (TPR) repeat protein